MTRIRCGVWCRHRDEAGLCRRMNIENDVYGGCTSFLPVRTCGECVHFDVAGCRFPQIPRLIRDPEDPASERCFNPREGGEADG